MKFSVSISTARHGPPLEDLHLTVVLVSVCGNV